MTDHVFGKPISRTFRAYENDCAIVTQSISSAALYSTLGDAVAATNVICSMSSWNVSPSDQTVINYNLPSLSEPTTPATSTRRVWQFWERINYKLDSNGQTQPEYRAIDVARAYVGDSIPGTTVNELRALFPALSSYLSDLRINDMLDLAMLRMKTEMKANTGQWAHVRNLQETKLALAYLAISMCEDSQYAKTSSDVFRQRRDDHEALYTKLMGTISLPSDSDGDGAVDEVRHAMPSFRYFPR